jgi:hypothetical protein
LVGFYAGVGDELILWVKQTAWLHAAPKDRDGKSGDMSRLEKMRDKDVTPLLPRNSAPYLTDWLFEIGPTSAGSMGEGPLGYRDFAAWQTISGVELMPWEASLLRRLSIEYAVTRNKAEDQAFPAPYGGEADDVIVNRPQVAKQVDAMFGKLKGKRG